MSSPLESFVERRDRRVTEDFPEQERRQFANSHAELSSEARELATAIDRYKLERRRRIVDFEELVSIIKSLGYRKAPSIASEIATKEVTPCDA